MEHLAIEGRSKSPAVYQPWQVNMYTVKADSNRDWSTGPGSTITSLHHAGSCMDQLVLHLCSVYYPVCGLQLLLPYELPP